MNPINKINQLRERYYAAAHGKQSLLDLISETEVSEQVYNSNAIENSTLTLEETEKILLQIDLERFITERELFEAKNLARVVKYIDSTAKEKELDINLILFLHRMLITNIQDDIAGRFRKKDEWVRVGNYIAVDPSLIEEKISKMLIQYYATPHESITKRIALLHLTFEHIHPFLDGNGRIGRVINNYMLIREGYVPINIRFLDRQVYYQAFREFDKRSSTSIMEDIVARAMINSYHKRLAYLEGREIITLSAYAKHYNLSHSNLLNKAQRQTIEAFQEKGVWKIGLKKFENQMKLPPTNPLKSLPT